MNCHTTLLLEGTDGEASAKLDTHLLSSGQWYFSINSIGISNVVSKSDILASVSSNLLQGARHSAEGHTSVIYQPVQLIHILTNKPQNFLFKGDATIRFKISNISNEVKIFITPLQESENRTVKQLKLNILLNLFKE
jgi:hypothetical protein